MDHTFSCEQCRHEQTFDPPAWPWVLVARPDRRGTPERLLYRRVRCAECGREQKVPVERGE